MKNKISVCRWDSRRVSWWWKLLNLAIFIMVITTPFPESCKITVDQFEYTDKAIQSTIKKSAAVIPIRTLSHVSMIILVNGRFKGPRNLSIKRSGRSNFKRKIILVIKIWNKFQQVWEEFDGIMLHKCNWLWPSGSIEDY